MSIMPVLIKMHLKLKYFSSRFIFTNGKVFPMDNWFVRFLLNGKSIVITFKTYRPMLNSLPNRICIKERNWKPSCKCYWPTPCTLHRFPKLQHPRQTINVHLIALPKVNLLKFAGYNHTNHVFPFPCLYRKKHTECQLPAKVTDQALSYSLFTL